ncbi:uncharacterized protein LOC116297002 [Actinia tenebrosa]|uniref:Uncharacterized protein LOC116297002 n=1 Tax=Actinia tenebrosa TaxID=6105 RepID=A0A6P8I7G2_ACTTE|nr:uncharacterized protein LOC116297002 [Actinia tenebrosa]
MTLWKLFLVVFIGGTIINVEGSLKCFCNSVDCTQDNSISCQAGYACYAEILNSTAKYGCIQRKGYTSLCVRQGSPPKQDADKQYLLLCCFKDYCNMPKNYKDKHFNVKSTPTKYSVKSLKRDNERIFIIPKEFAPLSSLSAKVLSVIAAGGLFTLILVIACAVHLLCFEKRNGKRVQSVVLKGSYKDVSHSSTSPV